MNDLNYLRKQAGLPPLVEVTNADITRALAEIHQRMLADKLDESIYSMLKATLATVGQKGSKANKAAAERATKLSGDIRKLYKETEAKQQLRLLYKQFTVMLTTLEKVDDGTKDLQDKDPDLKREIELFQKLISRITVDLQARAGVSVAVQEAFTEAELPMLLETFLTEAAHAKKYHVKYHVEPDKTMRHGIFHGHTLQNVVGMMAYGGYTVHSIEHADDHDGDDNDTPAPAVAPASAAPAAVSGGGDAGAASSGGGDAGGGSVA